MIVSTNLLAITSYFESLTRFVEALPNTAVVGVVVSFASAMIVYAARQSWERRKLRRALLAEVEQMEGLDECAKQMERVNSPPGRPIKADDVPTGGTIPTVVYESNAGRLGLLRGLIGKDELEPVVKFYSRVLRYKSIINDIRSEGKTSDADQEDLYDGIGQLSKERYRIVDSSEFT